MYRAGGAQAWSVPGFQALFRAGLGKGRGLESQGLKFVPPLLSRQIKKKGPQREGCDGKFQKGQTQDSEPRVTGRVVTGLGSGDDGLRGC